MALFRFRRLGSCVLASSFAFVAPVAFAQDPAPTPSPSPAPAPSPSPASPERVTRPVVSQTDDGSWKYRYDLARDRLVNGDFATAARMFDELANETRDPTQRALAKAQGDLAREWQARGLVLIKHSALGESALAAKAVNERTSDELAVLYTSSVLYGIGTGAWTAEMTKANSAAGVVLPMVLFSGAAAGTVAILDSGRPLRYGVPQSIVSGMYIGLEEGIAFALWNGASRDSSAQWSGETIATVVWGTATAGALAGGILGSAVGTTPGRASFVGSAALWTGVITGLTAGAFSSNDASAQGPLLAAAIGLNAGALGGILAAGPVSPSIARVRFLDLGGIAGGLLFGGLYLAAADKNGSVQAFTGTTAIGMATGLGVAWWATSGMHEDRLEEHRGEPGEASETKRSSFTFSPTLMPAKQGMMIGAQGTL